MERPCDCAGCSPCRCSPCRCAKSEDLETPSTDASQASPSSSSSSSAASPLCGGAPASTEEKMRAFLTKHGVADFSIVQVPSHYYGISLEERRAMLNAPSIAHLCKTVVLENTKHIGVDDKLNSKYYMVVVQYIRKVNGERVKDLIKQVNADRGLKLGNKKLNFNFCRTSAELTGFVYNAITPFASKTEIPVIVDAPLLALQPPLLWLGGGEVDLKLRVSLADLMRIYDPLVGSVCFEQDEGDGEGGKGEGEADLARPAEQKGESEAAAGAKREAEA
ncbi:YbaK/proline-tRNA ligase associated domain-containing protein [Besnoitia besnoiti]|uniref:YbaK/proline-tRNA ligase associated domain-containing protein n=1 Tax=Besnoitia besnoiti TaxID=94643 RepID=A0A2A9M8G8_BESBE|nr:YbaK/proline-tRNA ligase associated domain-containing protein [Besnoitia besnoiti]PFH33454.1 YbaK/proline-tRNA ligase associated domain-containing protein [Besnoitia besnoiti]